MINEMNPWEKGTPLDKLVRKEENADAHMAFIEKAEQYKPNAERIVAGEKLATLARGFLTGCGGMNNVTSEKCRQFASDFPGPVRKVLDTVPEDDLPAAVYALVKEIDKDK